MRGLICIVRSMKSRGVLPYRNSEAKRVPFSRGTRLHALFNLNFSNFSRE